jgi:hypothetical protein
MGFSDLKKKSKSGMEDLIKKMEDQTKTKDYKDDRFWRPEQDKSGNGFAIIRFLPPVDGEDVPWVKVYNHAFQGTGGWYIENSLTTSMLFLIQQILRMKERCFSISLVQRFLKRFKNQ